LLFSVSTANGAVVFGAMVIRATTAGSDESLTCARNGPVANPFAAYFGATKQPVAVEILTSFGSLEYSWKDAIYTNTMETPK
jgi:hypothetical protein